MEIIDIFYDHLEYILVIWYNLRLFGIVCGNLVYFYRFGTFEPRKIWQPCLQVDQTVRISSPIGRLLTFG
jgi:hypothetical protein